MSRSVWILACVLAGCGEAPREGVEPTAALTVEPDRVKVDHILIAAKNGRMARITRTKAEAGALARDLVARLRAGTADFAALKQEHSDDGDPSQPRGGPYTMVNHGVAGAEPPRVMRRDGMVPAFGDVSFHLAVGELGLAEMDDVTSPFGYHIIKRLE